ncbi:MAG: hypothetical protein HZA90_03210 [Verrucomicrobia bacterium]|nr:hypothetical protein [Verrucomicrobiota bacterium]
MTSFLDKLNLRPNERRLVVVVALVVVAFLYFWFIWPQFAEWKKLKNRKTDLQQTLLRFQKEIEKTDLYKRQQIELQTKGARVDPDLQSLDLARTVQNFGNANNVGLPNIQPGRTTDSGGKTNAFFEEKTVSIQYLADEPSLVNFLFALSSGDSLIRVSSMTVNPDPTRMKLMGNMTLVASYPKKAPAKSATTPATVASASPTATAPGPRPKAVTPGSKSISAAVTAATKPAATNAPASASWWGKVKGWFGGPAKGTNAPAKKPVAVTNAPPKKP